MIKENVYLVCDWTDDKAASISGTPNTGIEHLGMCRGRILREDGSEIGSHSSTTSGFLRSDLTYKLDNPDKYHIHDFIGRCVPDRFAKDENQ